VLPHQLTQLLDRTLSVYWAARAPFVLKARRAPIKRILEIGCGSGTWTSHLNALAPVVTLDLQPERVRAARVRTEREGGNSSLFLAASGEHLPLRNEAFDLVVSVDVIEHIPDDQLVLQEIARVTRPGGSALLTTLLDKRPTYLRKVVFADHLREYEPEHFAALFQQSGLREAERFFFYYFWSTLAAELQNLSKTNLGRIRFVGIALRVLLGLLARLDRLLPLHRPGGIGILAHKE
jgi:ubiquinone/menaquinone biosynthesis C-methylase UbiE